MKGLALGMQGSWGVLGNLVLLVWIVGLWLWDNKWTILGVLTIGIALGYGWR